MFVFRFALTFVFLLALKLVLRLAFALVFRLAAVFVLRFAVLRLLLVLALVCEVFLEAEDLCVADERDAELRLGVERDELARLDEREEPAFLTLPRLPRAQT